MGRSAAAVQRKTDELNIYIGAQVKRLVKKKKKTCLGTVPGVGLREGRNQGES